jgi:hypothetical protein
MYDTSPQELIETFCDNIVLLAHTREYMRTLRTQDITLAYCEALTHMYEWADNAPQARAQATYVRAWCDVWWHTHLPLITMDADNDQYLHVGKFSAHM